MIRSEPPPLSAAEGSLLLSVARRALRAGPLGEPTPSFQDPPERLRRPQGAFVTLRLRGSLRGCIGIIFSGDPLVEVVSYCALAAAMEDPRFEPVTRDELDEIAVEISVLGNPLAVSGPEEIEAGRHGVIVSQDDRRGLLLPQVAIEQGWDALTLLRETCLKAGLDADAWRRGARIEIFTAQIFSEI